MSQNLKHTDFRIAPLGRWSTGEIIPNGESVTFYPNGQGLHCYYCGLTCTKTYFEWEPDDDYLIRVRRICDSDGRPVYDSEPGDEGVYDADEWELVRYSVIPGLYYNQPTVHLRAMFGPLLALKELWYGGPVENGPVCQWHQASDQTLSGKSRKSSFTAFRLFLSKFFLWLCIGGLYGFILSLIKNNPTILLIGLATGLVSGVFFGWNNVRKPCSR